MSRWAIVTVSSRRFGPWLFDFTAESALRISQRLWRVYKWKRFRFVRLPTP